MVEEDASRRARPQSKQEEGAAASEQLLVQEIGLGCTPVREALQRLGSTG
jgi:DNA-binding GntR family transcriptional regulator